MSNASDFVIESGVLKKYVGPGGDVFIPEGVTSIDERTFTNCNGLTSVKIPESVTNIGYGAFLGCSNLTNATIPKSVTSIGGAVFCNCIKLKEVAIPKGVKSIEERTFFMCRSLTDITVPEGVTSIDQSAFFYCRSLTSVTIPEGVKRIGHYAFYGCSSLRSITIPESATSIGGSAFAECRMLASVSFPDSVTELGGDAFSETALEKDVRLYENGVLYLGKHLIKARKQIEVCSIKEGTLDIQSSAFSNCSKLTSVMIPGSVKKIGSEAFYTCHSLTSVTICKGVEIIDSGAFENCSALKSVSIPETVTEIHSRAFSECGNLTSIAIPLSVKSIGGKAFWDCGSLTDIFVPEGQSLIEEETFCNCSSLTSLMLPAGVRVIEENALKNCSKLQWIKSPVIPAKSAAPGCSFALLLYGESMRWLAYAAKADKDNLSDFAKPGKWNQYDIELINNGPNYKYKLPARLVGALGRLLDPVELTGENRAMYMEMLCKNAKKLISLAEETGEVGLVKALFSLNVLDEKTAKAVKKLLSASPVPALAALASEAINTALPMQEKKKEETAQSPLQVEYAAKLKSVKGDAIIKKMRMIGAAMPAVKLVDGTEAPEELFRFLLASYGGQAGGEYHFVPEADEAAKRLSYDSLCEAMDQISGHLDGPNYPAVLPLLCRFGNAKQIRALTEAYKGWGDWGCFGQKGRNAQDVLSCALVLSDTREAVVWLKKTGSISSIQKYALLRGLDLRGLRVADLYEHFLFDFGFDESGRRVFDLGSTTVEAVLTPDLKIALYDTAANKAVRSVPKKGAEPPLYQLAVDELTDMRQNLKKAAKIKSNQLFADYLDATEFPAERWKRSYLGNPFLRQIASLLIWAQGTQHFLPSADGPIDSAGKPLALTEEQVRLAHPMEMEVEEVQAWQKMLTHRGLKQPFLQVWEPVCRPESFRPDRY